MIICSSCHFENPSHHRYCQQCGGSLPDVIEMDKEGNVNAHNPLKSVADEPSPVSTHSHDGDHSAIGSVHDGSDLELTAGGDRPPLEEDYDQAHTRLAIIATPPLWWSSPNPPRYLDPAQRYQLLSTTNAEGQDPDHPNHQPTDHDQPTDIEVILLDRYADHLLHGLAELDTEDPAINPNPDCSGDTEPAPSDEDSPAIATEKNLDTVALSEENPLELQENGHPTIADPNSQTDHPTTIEESDEEGEAIAPDTSSPHNLDTAIKDGPVFDAITAQDTLVQIHLTLQDQLYPSFPPVLDTLGNNIVILENRSILLPLQEAITQADIVLPQILHWLHEMTELWEILIQHHCCTSLLAPHNIRVDEDQILCLRRLHPDNQDHPPTMVDLGHFWHQLRQSSSVPWPDILDQINQDLCNQIITDTETLQQRLERVADKIYQDTVTATEDGGTPEEIEWSPVEAPAELHSFAEKLRNIDDVETPQAFIPPDSTSHPEVSELDQPAGMPPSLGTGFGKKHPNSNDDPTIVLPMQLHTLSHVGSTSNGIQRDHNEDFFVVETHVNNMETPADRICNAKGLYILCDGMGGHSAGEVASALAGETLQTYFRKHWTDRLPDTDTIREGIILANQVIYERNQADHSEGFRRMGTTLVTLLIQDTKVAIAHVGDSRIYRFTRRQGLEQLTLDHEVGQREISRGVDPSVAYARPDAQQLTQALGPRDQDFIRPDIRFWEMNEDSLFILGSDGLTDNDLLETHCQSHIEPLISGNTNLEEGAFNLVDLANQVNGHDNITVILVRVKLRPKLSLLGR
ncbi:MAG: serine/threonine phosphatase [Leptolyngbyaceae bacterium]|nr:serine/threonine phosphatase [Leptolyngbyaceae bacterium]